MALNFSVIIPGKLWVGGYVREVEVPQLNRIGITDVISLQTDRDLKRDGVSPSELMAAYERSGIRFRRVPTQDYDREALEENLPAAVAQVSLALSDPTTRVYLHCTAGISRSPTTAAAYLIESRGITAAAACEYLVSRRDCSPILDILERFEASLRKVQG